ncbi:MAG TPA: BatD family protein [Vicinamibacteria bacterium]|nr:BatD family protein [Vicinamibacteria bacterium]
MTSERRARRAWPLAVVAVLAPASAGAFTVRSEVDARKVGVQDQVQLTLTVEGSGGPDEIPLPALKNLEVVGGPFQSTQVSIVNGRMSQSRSFTYVLQPRAVGGAEVGAVRAGDQAAPAIPIEVVAGSIRPPEPRRQDPFASPFGGDPLADPFEEMLGRRRGRATAAKLLVEATPSRTRLRVGEPLVLTYSLDTQTSVTDLQLKEAPQFAGFWVEDLERPQTSSSGEAVTIEGESYRRFPVLRKLLFPTRAGTLGIPSATFRIGLARQSFFDTGGAVERATKPLSVTVEPLPETPGFSGAVGRFRATAALDRDVVPLGEAVTLRFRVEGTGNLKWIEHGPAVTLKGAKVFPPQARSDLRTTTEGIAGSRTWEFVVVPETTGTVEVPPLSFPYFDPAAGRIVSVETAPLALRVEGGTAAAGPHVPAPTAGATANSTLPLRSDLDARGATSLSGRAVSFLAGLALFLHAGIWGASRLRGVSRRRDGRTASPRSVRAALRDLERAAGEAASKEEAASLVEKALHEAFGEIADDDDGERARALRSLLDDARFVRYAPQLGEYGDKVRDLAGRAAAAVRRWA